MVVRRRAWFFFFGWLGMLLYFTQRWILGPLIPALMADFGVDKTVLGIVGSASFWGYMMTPILAGLLSDRFGRKYAVLSGIVGFSVLAMACALVNGPGQLIGIKLLTGVAEAFFFVPLMAFTLEVFPERPGFYLTLMSSGSSLGWFTGPVLAGWLLHWSGSWRLPFVTTGLLGLVVAGLMLINWPLQERQGKRSAFFDRSLLAPAHLTMIGLLGLVAACSVAAEFGFTMWLPAFLELETGMDPAGAGFIAGFYGVGQCLGRPVLGWVSDRLGYRPVGIIGAFALGISLFLILNVNTSLFRGLFTFQAGFIGAALMGSVWTFTGLLFPSAKGLALGMITTLAYVVASGSPALIGYVADQHSVRAGLNVVSVPAAFTGGLFFLTTFLIRRSGGSRK